MSRQPLQTIQRVDVAKTDQCKWFQRKIEEVEREPEKNVDYAIIDGQLYRQLESHSFREESIRWKLYVPSQQRERVLAECHDSTTTGHFGIRKTITRACGLYYWPGMMRDIVKYVRNCDSCQRYNVSQLPPAGEVLTKIARAPWETVCAYFIGPIPRSKHGNTMLLVVVDKFTKWVELVPLRRSTGETLTRAFRHYVVLMFGTPKVLICNNGTQFTCKGFQKYLQSLGVHQQFTAPYTPQENPTERMNRTVKTSIAQVSKNTHTLWDEYLPEIAMAVNTSKSETTGFSPAFLMQGRELRLPGRLYDESLLGNGTVPERPDEKCEKLREIYDIVRNNLRRAANSQAKHYNLRRRNWKPEVGTMVLVRKHHLSKAADNFAAKLAPRFDGPYVVWAYKSPVILELQKPGTKRISVAHISDVKLYHSDPQVPNLDEAKNPEENAQKVRSNLIR